MSGSELLQQIRPYLDAIFLTGNGPNWVTVQGFIGQHTPLGVDATDRSIEEHILAIHEADAKDYEIRVVATYLLQDVCGYFKDLPDKG